MTTLQARSRLRRHPTRPSSIIFRTRCEGTRETAETRALEPASAGKTGDGEKRLSDIGGAVLDTRRHLRHGLVTDGGGPANQLVAQEMANVGMDASAVGLDYFHRPHRRIRAMTELQQRLVGQRLASAEMHSPVRSSEAFRHTVR